MAVKDKDGSKQSAVTRITASSDKKPVKARPKAADKTTPAPKKRPGFNPLRPLVRMFRAILGYFKGAWFELRQVRWPNRRATWSMTGALLAFTAFFVIFILLIDALFEYLFKLAVG